MVIMAGETDSSNFPDPNNPQGRNIPNYPSHQIVWVDSEDVYKPIQKSFNEFTKERGIPFQKARVYIKEDALQNLITHLSSNLRVEQGGILFGNAYQDLSSGTIYVEITAAVAAPATIGTGAHLDFTPDSWTGIMDYAKVEHPEENIVGWYHSHPNIGVFMSGTDMRTQKAFFHHPWCLSIVCDPVRREIDYFLGEQAVPVKPVKFGQNSSYLVDKNIDWEDEPKPIENTENTNTENKKYNQRKVRPFIRFNRRDIKSLSLLLVLLLAVLFIFQQLIFTSKEDLSLQVEIKTMPTSAFEYLKQEKDLLRYPIHDLENISGGDSINFLLISPKNYAKIELVKLELQQFNNTQNASIIDLIRDSQNTLSQQDSLGEEKISLDTPETRDGVIVPLSSVKKINVLNKPKNQVSDIVFIPRQLVYKDSKKKEQKAQIKDLLSNGK